MVSVALTAFMFYLTGWVADDAYIDFRVVSNLLSGFGPVWNVGERVQVFTSPVWVALVSLLSLITGAKAPIAALILSLVCDCIVIVIAVAMGIRKPLALALALVCLFCSQSFLDYSSSGLENPLLHALAAMLCLVLWREPKLGASKTLSALSLLCGIALCTRLDTLLVAGSVLAFHAIRRYREVERRRTIRAILLGISPFFLWECFSIFYYGAFVPNTALAKLPLGYPRADLIHKGLTLLQATAVQDPGTLFSIAAIPIVLLLLRSPLWLPSTLASATSLTYVIWVGGDFMLGRFVSFVFVFSWMCLLAGVQQKHRLGHVPREPLFRALTRLFALAALLAAMSALSILSLIGQLQQNKFSANYGFQIFFKKQIADERAFYNRDSSLRAILAGRVHPWLAEGEQFKQFLAGRKALAARRTIGMYGYAAGPSVFIVDSFALADPFLSRLPACIASRPGHITRPMPAGYLESLKTGRNAMSDNTMSGNAMNDPLLAQLLDDTFLATKASLWAHGRIAAIWRLNTGTYNDPQKLARYASTPEGFQNIGVDRGNESLPCPTVFNGARTDILAVADYGVQSPPWSAISLNH
jgi:arabinofuranosyltransferase